MGRKVTIAGAVKSTATTGVASNDTALVWTASKAGEEANNIGVLIRKPGPESDLDVTVKKGRSTRITVVLATDEEGAVTTTAADLAEAVADATDLVEVTDGADSDGSGTAAPASLFYLAGGRDSAPNEVVLPDGNRYGEGDEITLTNEQFARLSPTALSGYLVDGGTVSIPGEAPLED